MSAALTARLGEACLDHDGLGRPDYDSGGDEDDDDGGGTFQQADSSASLEKNVWFAGRRQTSTTAQHSQRTWPFKTASGTPSVEQPGSAFTTEEEWVGGRSVVDDDDDDDDDDDQHDDDTVNRVT